MNKSDFKSGKFYKYDGEILQFMYHDDEKNICFQPKSDTKFKISVNEKDGVKAIRFWSSSEHHFTKVGYRLTLSDTKKLLVSEVQKALDEQDFLFILELQNMFEEITIKN